jgi:hypothetical protein
VIHVKTASAGKVIRAHIAPKYKHLIDEIIVHHLVRAMTYYAIANDSKKAAQCGKEAFWISSKSPVQVRLNILKVLMIDAFPSAYRFYSNVKNRI